MNKKKMESIFNSFISIKIRVSWDITSPDRSQRQEGRNFVKSICLSFCNMTNLTFSCLMGLSVKTRKLKNIHFINGISIRTAMKENVKNCYTLSTVQDWEFSQTLSSCNLLIHCIWSLKKHLLWKNCTILIKYRVASIFFYFSVIS